MSDTLTNEQYGIIDAWIDANGYETLETWADDSGYFYSEVDGSEGWWTDEHGNPVDLYEQAWYAREAEQELATEIEIGV